MPEDFFIIGGFITVFGKVFLYWGCSSAWESTRLKTVVSRVQTPPTPNSIFWFFLWVLKPIRFIFPIVLVGGMPYQTSFPSIPSVRRVRRKKSVSAGTHEAVSHRLGERKREGAKAVLQEIHGVPFWFELGKQISFHWGSLEPARIDSFLHSENPMDVFFAEKRLKDHFDYVARRQITMYFSLKPNSPVSFESVYSRMLDRQFAYFVLNAKRKGVISASTLLSRSFTVSDKSSHLSSFEDSFVKGEDSFGEWRKNNIRTRFFSPPSFEDVHSNVQKQRENEQLFSRRELLRYLSIIPSERNRGILCRFFGIGMAKESAIHIARSLGITRGRVHGIVKRELERMRNYPPVK